MMIDTHCHLNIMTNKEPEALLTAHQLAELETVMAHIHDSGVGHMVCVGTSVPESRNCIAIAERYARVAATIGVHPCDITQPVEVIISELESLINAHRKVIVGIGEIGLDYYHQPYDKHLQEVVFKAQLALAIKYELPVVIHIRDAGDDALAILELYKDTLHGVIHCFSLDKAAAEKIISWGWYIGIDGPITYPKNNYLREIVATVPLTGIFLETDAPFLPPQHLRGKRNCPSNLGIIAQAIADARGVSFEDVVRQTTANAKELFRI
ncbi:MAG: TatD DNase family protein [Candidatus Dependentiae bacterium]|nr:TatD DNase family protein [Candidatus Dependentiae bacterium]